jgi:nitroreductase
MMKKLRNYGEEFFKTKEIMKNPASTKIPLHELIRQRWSPRAFSDRSVEKEKLFSLFEAARWAPSCFNEQPWSWIVATKEQPEEFQKLLECLVPGNQLWAKEAPVLMLSVAKLFFEKNKKDNRHAYHDVGLAVENLVLQATALGLVVHQMAGFDVEKARAEFQIPEGFDPVAAIALGYEGDPTQLPENLREKELAPRSRKELKDFVFTEKWGETFLSL